MIFIIIGIVIVFIVLFWIVLVIHRNMSSHNAFLTQLRFLQIYIGDTTDKQFYNKDVDEAMRFGQDMLWQAAEDFNERMYRAIIKKEPIVIGDIKILEASIKIIKAAESMVFIKKNGPILNKD